MGGNESVRSIRPPLPAPLTAPLRVLVVDDHDLFRSGLCGLLSERGFEIVGDVPDGDSAVKRLRWLRPDVVVLGLELSGLSGAETARRLAETLPGVRIVGFLVTADPATVDQAVTAGVHSYLMKDATVEEIVDGIRLTAAGESVLSPRVATLIVRRLQAERRKAPTAQIGSLTEREGEVLPLLVAGKSNVEIAAALFISPRTAKNHIASILDKLGAENRIQAAVEAVRRGLVA
jgi:two-component system nitrate/nitrite response regulator NarL